MTVPTAKTEPTARRPRAGKEAVLAAAVDVARAAVEELAAPEMIGDHEGVRVEGDRLLTHYFATLQPGYRGWHWAVTLSRAPRGRTATVCEVSLLPGEGALLAPEWVPWSERLQPADIVGTDVLPYDAEDMRLVAGSSDTTENLDRREIEEMGLGRARVLSPEGFDRAATRWYEGDHGPHSPAAEAAPAPCSTCGFFVKLAGTPRMMFGVCANEWAQDDGRVVSVDHGCGSHSETDTDPRPPLWNAPGSILDEGSVEEFVLPQQEAARARVEAADRAGDEAELERTRAERPEASPVSEKDAVEQDAVEKEAQEEAEQAVETGTEDADVDIDTQIAVESEPSESEPEPADTAAPVDFGAPVDFAGPVAPADDDADTNDTDDEGPTLPLPPVFGDRPER